MCDHEEQVKAVKKPKESMSKRYSRRLAEKDKEIEGLKFLLNQRDQSIKDWFSDVKNWKIKALLLLVALAAESFAWPFFH
ncbi:hypothetical protein GEM21_05495 [Salmonella enterica]|nr:hypothetical protein [Salmonella enterica]EEO2148466.1 hypothetical protein [Salmonella enterica]EIL8912102.1 hypothetical protein [Salmonella enterica]